MLRIMAEILHTDLVEIADISHDHWTSASQYYRYFYN